MAVGAAAGLLLVAAVAFWLVKRRRQRQRRQQQQQQRRKTVEVVEAPEARRPVAELPDAHNDGAQELVGRKRDSPYAAQPAEPQELSAGEVP